MRTASVLSAPSRVLESPWVGLLLVLAATCLFGARNVGNAARMAPHWGQDLAFFSGLVHSAAQGGPWASTLILEPQGFLAMVHSHLILPVVVAAYALVPGTNTLLWLHSFGVSLALWPAWRLGRQVGGAHLGLLAALALVVFGPFQAVATADFRPSGLFVAGVLGVFAAAHRGDRRGMCLWALLLLAARNDGAWLVLAVGCALVLMPFGGGRRRDALGLLALGATALVAWALLKESAAFHVNPGAGFSLPEGVDWGARGTFLLRVAVGGLALGLLAPAPLLGLLPVVLGMLSTGREWQLLVGPGAHHHAFWLPFVLAAAIVGAGRIPRGGVLLVVLAAASFPWAVPRMGPVDLADLADQVPAEARIAADYDSIHRVAPRAWGTLWNVAHLQMDPQERPHAWPLERWPLTVEDVDALLLPIDHPVADQAGHWRVAGVAGAHVLLLRPD
jgi:hypothetical protein